ncbi:hypothetical protein [Neisseria polysaccharea]|uniref:hypothetical protein n=1 Tax=Neisseria polysaccharea TaxID=489 RepID=UPI003556E951
MAQGISAAAFVFFASRLPPLAMQNLEAGFAIPTASCLSETCWQAAGSSADNAYG